MLFVKPIPGWLCFFRHFVRVELYVVREKFFTEDVLSAIFRLDLPADSRDFSAALPYRIFA